MIILVGGRGFLAAHTRIALGMTPRILVSRLPPTHPTLSEYETWMSREDFDGLEGEVVLREAKAIVYLASASVPGDFLASIGDELATNVTPATNLLDRLAAMDVSPRFIYISSGGTVYGTELPNGPVTEDHPLAPISPYGMGKVLTEEAVRFSGRTRGLRYAILRVANPVGPFTISEKQGIVPAAFRAIRSGMPLRVFGNGEAERDYLSAVDVGRAIVAAVEAIEFERAVWNVGSSCGRSVLEILSLVRDATGRDVPVEFVPARGGDVKRIVLDCRRIANDLGWRADNDLTLVIKNMWCENV